MRTFELCISMLVMLTGVHSHDMAGMTDSTTSTASTTTQTDSDMTTMMNVFHTGLGDSLFWTSWKPTTKVAYAFTFFALVLLGMASRALSAYIIRWDRTVRATNVHKARSIIIRPNTQARVSINESQSMTNESPETVKESKELYTSTSRPSSVGESRIGTDDDVRTWSAASRGDQVDKIANAWRISVDVPRGFLQFLSHGLGFLMMLAVMTGNVGYFFAVLVGVFLGEVAFGRLAHL